MQLIDLERKTGVADGTRTHDDRNHNPVINSATTRMKSSFPPSDFPRKHYFGPTYSCRFARWRRKILHQKNELDATRKTHPNIGAEVAKELQITMPDGSKWNVPIDVIARNRAAHYASEFDGDVDRSLAEDTMPLFEEDDYEIEDWAANNMNWSDVEHVAYKAKESEPPDFQEAWMNGEKEIVEVD